MTNRRTALKLAAMGVAAMRVESAQHQMSTLAAKPAQYKLQFFSAKENELLDTLAEMILPADEHSPGARRAMASLYMDLIVANSDHETQNKWRSGLKAFDETARRLYGAGFDSLPPGNRTKFLDGLARTPADAAGRFFADVRHATIFAYYTSRIGLIEELGYQGNQAMGSFPGCTSALKV